MAVTGWKSLVVKQARYLQKFDRAGDGCGFDSLGSMGSVVDWGHAPLRRNPPKQKYPWKTDALVNPKTDPMFAREN